MKKLLFLTLLITTVSFGKQQGNQSSAKMSVKAEVIPPITVEAADMDFGTVVAGAQNNFATAPVTIKSEPYQRIRVKVTSPTASRDGVGLIGPRGSKQLFVKLSSIGDYPAQNIYWVNNAPLMQSIQGQLLMNVKGELDVPLDQKSGLYTGNLNFAVRYD
nr:hypothetical protein [uncultured Cetobacterium sp.]